MDAPLSCLTPRMRQVAFLVAVGFSCHEIARKCFRCVQSIINVLGKACRRVGVRNKIELTRWAIRVGVAPVRFSVPVTAREVQHSKLSA